VKNFILVLSFFIVNSSLGQIAPTFKLNSKGSVTDFIIEKDTLYAATDQSLIDLFIISKNKKVASYSIPTITDFTDKIIPAKIFSIDKIKNNDDLLIVSQGVGGFRDVFIINKHTKTKVIVAQLDKMMIKRAVFISKNTILLGLLSNELVLYDIIGKKNIYNKHLSTSVFSDFIVDKTKQIAITCDESGIVRFVGSRSGTIMLELNSENVDNIYKIDFQNNKVITAGQDRRVAFYDIKKKTSYHKESDFLVYSVALSKDAKLGAYSANENNDIFVFNTATRKVLYKLRGQPTTQTKIFFLDNKTIIASSEDAQILVWKLK